MNWIEKFHELRLEACETCVYRSNSYNYHFSLCNETSSDKERFSFPELETRIKNGDINMVKYIVTNLKPQLEVYKKIIKAVKSYEKFSKVAAYYNNSRYPTCYVEKPNGVWDMLSVVYFKTDGVLQVAIPSWAQQHPVIDTEKFFLYCSRMLRDAEKRCLKHPKFQTV